MRGVIAGVAPISSTTSTRSLYWLREEEEAPAEHDYLDLLPRGVERPEFLLGLVHIDVHVLLVEHEVPENFFLPAEM
jgi:hypothetical protein